MIAKNIKLTGKIICKTGLHIGNIEGVRSPRGCDAPVLQNPVLQTPEYTLPYISASSLRGKLRNIAEYLFNHNGFNKKFHDYNNPKENIKYKKLFRHECQKLADAINCNICSLFGFGGEDGQGFVGRLIFKDIKPIKSEHSLESKFENTLKRLVREANPRIIERVCPDTEFSFKIIYQDFINDKNETTVSNISRLLACMRFLEDSYLGGNGTRGSGKILFSDLYLNDAFYNTLKEMQKNLPEIIRRREHEK